MKILFPTAECEPFAKTGGLGDVGSALPNQLAKQSIDIRVIMPFYHKVQEYFEYQVYFVLTEIMTDKEGGFE